MDLQCRGRTGASPAVAACQSLHAHYAIEIAGFHRPGHQTQTGRLISHGSDGRRPLRSSPSSSHNPAKDIDQEYSSGTPSSSGVGSLALDLKRVGKEIGRVEKKIESVEEAIEEARTAKDQEELRYLRDEKNKLLDKEKQLRDKEKQLREEKNKLLDERKQLREQAASTPPALRPAPEELQAFWRELANAKLIIMHSGKVLQLAGNTSFLGDERLGKQMMVRDCYVLLWEKLEEAFSAGEYGRVIIGTPGIGKSMFGYYVLWRWACRGERVVLRKDQFMLEKPFLLCPDGAFGLTDEGYESELLNPRTRFLLDAPESYRPGFWRGKFVMVTSPKPERYKEIVKSRGTSELFMSVWDWNELEECRSLVFPSLAPDDVRGRYERWGGLPRYVLEKTW